MNCVLRPVKNKVLISSSKTLSLKAVSGDGANTNELESTANLDKLIDLMLEAKEDEMPSLIGQNVMSFNQKFFMRIATRNDSSTDEVQKLKLAELAGMTMRLLDKMVSQTSNKMSDSGEVLQIICAAAADPVSGELEVPLNYQQICAMRKAMSERSEQMDEAVLAQAYSWIRKSSDNGLEGMVTILQRVLQLYAAYALVPNASPTAEANTPTRSLEEVLSSNIEDWERILSNAADQEFGGVFIEELQKKMEEVVLGMPNGSYAQRVLAEYLKQVEDMARKAFETAQEI
eukprot:CAMPEP_0196586568 /NCGR_PEP_ID=MMETSP1081-20130531/54802_1 /TAXON_ID=36882 /ORGANISM="Pyramimonas amylifera, Strain CCMP720" /LENGTH=287 /DNA_ID=CAMNT_0041908491 /DNA_START=131 /DNA_END=994 /DNA_ORIENTATION=-